MRAWKELELVRAKLQRIGCGTERDRLLRRRRTLEDMLKKEGDKAYFMQAPKASKFGACKTDVDCGLKHPRTKLHAVELRLDQQISDRNERQRLQRKKERLTRVIKGRTLAGFGQGRREVKRETIAILDKLESHKLKEDQ